MLRTPLLHVKIAKPLQENPHSGENYHKTGLKLSHQDLALRTVLACHVGVAGLREQIKAGDWGEALLRTLDDVIQLGVDKVGDRVPRTLHPLPASALKIQDENLSHFHVTLCCMLQDLKSASA